MKKTYITPQTEVFHIVITSMIAQSTVRMDSTDGNKLGSEEILVKKNNWDVWGHDDIDESLSMTQ